MFKDNSTPAEPYSEKRPSLRVPETKTAHPSRKADSFRERKRVIEIDIVSGDKDPFTISI